MFDPTPEPVSHARIWSTQPVVELSELDDKRLVDYRHPDEWRALIAIGVGVVVFFTTLALVHPSVPELLRWVPLPLARALLEALHPARVAPMILLIILAFAALDAVGLVLQRYDLPYNTVEITPVTFPQFGPIVEELKRRFDLPQTCVFATRSAPLGGNALGVSAPYLIVFSTAMLGSVTADEFQFLLGRQLGHVKLGHTRMALLFGSGHRVLSLSWLQHLRSFVFGNYQRAQELSADRIGLLATRDLRPVLSLLIKLQIGSVRGAKIDLETLAPRAAELQGGPNARRARLRQLLTAEPRFIVRLLELTQWAGLPPAPAPAAAPAAVAPGPAAAVATAVLAVSTNSGSLEAGTHAPEATAARPMAPDAARPSAAQRPAALRTVLTQTTPPRSPRRLSGPPGRVL